MSVDGLVMALTGMRPPEGSAVGVRALEAALKALGEGLGVLQELAVSVAGSVAGSAGGLWSEAYVGAMRSFASGDGADYVAALRKSAEELTDFLSEFAYQLDYTNRMIVAQVVQFVFEWALTLVMAVWNPVGALVEQAFLRAFYRVVLRSFILRFLAAVGMHEVLNVGLGAAMDGLVRWSLAADGFTTSHGGEYAKQAAEFGAVQGAFGAFVPLLGGVLGSGLGR
ncbi:hypothetical protein ABZ770_32485, partial [Streptomyces sp. NPDC006654]|uniref:WXG100-like domain-containing protein n=1 Tax=Streptomyces sp. NPDC006654 TaxID=3156897 RepID=UPI003406A7E5